VHKMAVSVHGVAARSKCPPGGGIRMVLALLFALLPARALAHMIMSGLPAE
jgi:hypothetical protein